MAKAINLFDDDSYSRGQGMFPDGPTRWDSFRFGTFDYGKPGNDQIVLIGHGQPLNADGTDNGDPRVNYWSVGRDMELTNPVKGEKGTFSGLAFAESNQYGKIFGLSDFGIFVTHLKNAAKLNPELVDLDEAASDITSLDGLLCETAKYAKPPKPEPKVKDDDKSAAPAPKKEPFQVIVISALLDPATFGEKEAEPVKKSAIKSGPVAVAAATEAKPVSKANGKGTNGKATSNGEVSDDPDDIVAAYVAAKLTEDMEGEQPLGFKIGISSWATKTLGKQADVARAAQASLKDNFAGVLKANGWLVAGGKLAKEAE